MNIKIKVLLTLTAAALFSACASSETNDEQSVEAPVTSAETTTTTQQETETTTTELVTSDEPQHESYDDGLYADAEPLWDEEDEEDTALLSQPSDIGIYDIDGANTNFRFTYGDEEYTAIYTPDNWKIVDSYKIDNYSDMQIICQALIEINPVHGSDMQSYRTAEDMAYEWEQHNIAYAILPEDSAWRNNAKDVDLNPADQGKSIYELYKDRTGQDLTLE